MKEQLKKEYPYRLEMHCHTSPASPCGDLSPREVISLYKENGVDAVIITNHFFDEIFKMHFNENDFPDKETKMRFYLKDYREAVKVGEELGVKVFLGAELRFPKESFNDFILVGAGEETLYDVLDFTNLTLREFREKMPLPDCVLIQAHPMRKGCFPVSTSLIDGVEGLNMHPGHNNRNSVVLNRLRTNPDMIITAGSDFHHPDITNECGGLLRLRKIPKTSKELVEVLKSRDYIIELGLNSIVLP